jgi:hypothetical protein
VHVKPIARITECESYLIHFGTQSPFTVAFKELSKNMDNGNSRTTVGHLVTLTQSKENFVREAAVSHDPGIYAAKEVGYRKRTLYTICQCVDLNRPHFEKMSAITQDALIEARVEASLQKLLDAGNSHVPPPPTACEPLLEAIRQLYSAEQAEQAEQRVGSS